MSILSEAGEPLPHSSQPIQTERLTGPSVLASVVLLGGSVRSSRFHAAIERWALDLPCAPGKTLLDMWAEGVDLLSQAWGSPVPLRILADASREGSTPSHMPANAVTTAGGAISSMTVDKDPIELRGTGGVLRDISGGYPPQSFLLVANAAQVLLRPLPDLARTLDSLGGDVAVLAHADGTPTTLMLVRCGALAALPALGFLDMKEQALPQLAARSPVRVVSTPAHVSMGVRTGKSYIDALRAYHLRKGVDGSQDAQLPESWRSAFHLVEEGATVDMGARLHDSVVLKGGRVERGAIVARSVVCPGGIVRAGETVVDKLVLASGDRVPTEEAS
jgi:hypothetical protein